MQIYYIQADYSCSPTFTHSTLRRRIPDINKSAVNPSNSKPKEKKKGYHTRAWISESEDQPSNHFWGKNGWY